MQIQTFLRKEKPFALRFVSHETSDNKIGHVLILGSLKDSNFMLCKYVVRLSNVARNKIDKYGLQCKFYLNA